MNIINFLNNPEWDTPFFKVLARNDTGDAPGHQGGMVLPKDLRIFFPSLDDASASSKRPTIERFLQVEMFVATGFVSVGKIRYQIQTWSGERAPEARLTNGLKPIRDRAQAGDILLFQRHCDALDAFRLVLIEKTHSKFPLINKLIANRRWGALYENDVPLTKSSFDEAKGEIVQLSSNPFVVRPLEIPRNETRQNRIARGTVFREHVKLQYRHKCAVSNIGIATPEPSIYEVESAHIVPISQGGPDDFRNGIALSQTLHWAFDKGLFGILPKIHRVYLPAKVKSMKENSFLHSFDGKQITEAKSELSRIHDDALEWHMENLVKAWA